MGSFPPVVRLPLALNNQALALIVLVGLAAQTLPAPASEPADSSLTHRRIAEHLDAGEFAPAIQLAGQLGDVSVRDKALSRIARAQQHSGATRGASRTIRSIADDAIRGDTVDRLLTVRFEGQPFLAQFDGGNDGGNINSTADFDAVIDLIQSTIEPDSWEEAGGTGRIAEFETGVRIDAEGELHRVLKVQRRSPLVRLRQASRTADSNRDVRQASPLRKISLPRLERQVQLRLAEGKRPTEAMKLLAGLERIKYVFVYPETGDLIIAGPAGDWQAGSGTGPVSVESGRPVLQLDDLVVLLRMMRHSDQLLFGCSITPTKQGLARTQRLAEESRGSKLGKGEQARERWVEKIRQTMGRQSIDIYGVDPQTRVAHVIVEADYHMKLIGMGLEQGAGNVVSYLDSMQLAEGEAPPALGVLRWWFSLNYQALQATEQGDAFGLSGQGVQVLSENERLSQQGERIHTGKSDKLTRGFARSFTENFPRLVEKYPMYADLQNVFDMALVGALFKERELPELVDWQLTCFINPRQYQVARDSAPQWVDSVINHRAFPTGQVVAGVSGGVRVDPSAFVRADALRPAEGAELSRTRKYAQPPKKIDRWWWD